MDREAKHPEAKDPKEKRPRPADRSCGCEVSIHIESHGDVNIYNCTKEGAERPKPPDRDDKCPPRAEGACVPLGLGAKPKQSKRRKLEKLVARNRVPSALGASFFQTGRRFLGGAAPANDFERDVFPIFSSLRPELRAILSCAVDSFESTPPDLRNAGLDPAITEDPDRPVDRQTLTTALIKEISQRASESVLGNPLALEEERPGRNRFFKPEGEIFIAQFQICRINNLRTALFRPPIPLGEYLPAEIQQNCELQLGPDGVIRQNCTVQTAPCPGNQLADGVCARVLEVASGEAVVLTGVNFMNVDMKARLTARVGTATAEVDAHVFGDLDTPLDEPGDAGTRRLINDCRVKDRATFVVPPELPPGIYELVLTMPNTTGIDIFGPVVLSNAEFINIVPPSTARFQIVAERVRARRETSPASFGSDEVAFTVLAAELLPDGSTGSLQRLDRRFGDVDSGDNRTVDAVIFANAREIVGMAMTIVGFEVDSERAFREQITDFTDAFVDYVTRAWDKFREELGSGAAAAIKALGFTKGAIAIAIAAAVAAAIIAVVAYWAPADLIMDDAIGFSAIELAELTNASAPSPPIQHLESVQGLGLNITPLEKGALTYREFREYVSDEEESNYEVYLRYNRTA